MTDELSDGSLEQCCMKPQNQVVPAGGARALAADSRWCPEVVPDPRPKNLGGARFSEITDFIFRKCVLHCFSLCGAAGGNFEASRSVQQFANRILVSKL